VYEYEQMLYGYEQPYTKEAGSILTLLLPFYALLEKKTGVSEQT
jgi:hypothetical protein